MGKFKIANILVPASIDDNNMTVEVVYDINGQEIRKNYRLTADEDINTFLEKLNNEVFRLSSNKEKILQKKVQLEDIKGEEIDATDPSSFTPDVDTPEPPATPSLQYKITGASIMQGFVVDDKIDEAAVKEMMARLISPDNVAQGYVNVKSIKKSKKTGKYSIKLNGVDASSDFVGWTIQFSDMGTSKLSKGFSMTGTMLAVPYKHKQFFSGGGDTGFIEKTYKVKSGNKYRVTVNLELLDSSIIAEIFDKYSWSPVGGSDTKKIFVEFADAYSKKYEFSEKSKKKSLSFKFVAGSDALKIRFHSDPDVGACIVRIFIKHVFI